MKRYRRGALTFLAIAVSLAIAAVQQRQTVPSAVRVTEVVDGDTVRITGGRLLRYIGIDTPEVREKTNAGYQYRPYPFSLEATSLNKSLVEGKDIRIEYDVEKADKYKRLLGYCFVKDAQGREIFVNERIVEEGLGLLFTFPPNVKYTARLLRAQQKARDGQKGLWGTITPIDPAQAHEWVGKLACVRGRVLSCYNSGKAYFLNFGSKKKEGFTVVIFAKDRFYFQQKDIEPCDYHGKTIEVIGKIKLYKEMPEMIVRDPSQITVMGE